MTDSIDANVKMLEKQIAKLQGEVEQFEAEKLELHNVLTEIDNKVKQQMLTDEAQLINTTIIGYYTEADEPDHKGYDDNSYLLLKVKKNDAIRFALIRSSDYDNEFSTDAIFLVHPDLAVEVGLISADDSLRFEDGRQHMVNLRTEIRMRDNTISRLQRLVSDLKLIQTKLDQEGVDIDNLDQVDEVKLAGLHKREIKRIADELGKV